MAEFGSDEEREFKGWMAEWSCSGLQSRLRRFDSGFSLHELKEGIYL